MPAALHSALQGARRGALSAMSAALGAVAGAGAPPLPTINSAEGWAFKNAALAAQTLMLGATAAGLGSLAMEGFDARMAAAALDIPWPRYAVPIVVALGYSAGSPTHAALTPSVRPLPERVFHLDRFGMPFPFNGEVIGANGGLPL